MPFQFPFMVLAYIAGIPLIIGAFCAGMVCALATGFLAQNSRVKQDTVMGVVFSGMFGFGIVLYTQVTTDVHLNHILFGNMLWVGADDLWTAGGIAAVVSLLVIARRRALMLHAFDPIQARASGLAVGVLHYRLLALLSLTIVAALISVALILAISLLIAPGAIAFLVARRFERMLAVAVVVKLFAGFTGIYASFFIGSSPAPTVVLVLTILFLAAFAHTLYRRRAA